MERFLEREQEVEEFFRCKYSSKTYSLSSIFVFLPGFKKKILQRINSFDAKSIYKHPRAIDQKSNFNRSEIFFSGLLEGFLVVLHPLCVYVDDGRRKHCLIMLDYIIMHILLSVASWAD